MRRTLIVCAGALLLAAPAAAHEKHGKHAKVFKAHLEAAEEGSDARGRAHLLDGRKRDKVSLHVKGLEPGGTYTWEVRDGSCDDAAATASEGWTYRELKVRPSGNANAKGRSEDFSAGEEDTSVAVTGEDGTVVACGDFEPRRAHRHERDDDDKSKGHGRGHRKP